MECRPLKQLPSSFTPTCPSTRRYSRIIFSHWSAASRCVPRTMIGVSLPSYKVSAIILSVPNSAADWDIGIGILNLKLIRLHIDGAGDPDVLASGIAAQPFVKSPRRPASQAKIQFNGGGGVSAYIVSFKRDGVLVNLCCAADLAL